MLPIIHHHAADVAGSTDDRSVGHAVVSLEWSGARGGSGFRLYIGRYTIIGFRVVCMKQGGTQYYTRAGAIWCYLVWHYSYLVRHYLVRYMDP